MSELSEILRKEYKKKEKKKPIDFSMLMEMVEQLYDAIEPEVMGAPQEPEIILEDGAGTRERVLRLPSVIPTEISVGQKPGSEDRKQFELWMGNLPLEGGSDKSAVASKLTGITSFFDNPATNLKNTTVPETLSYLMFLNQFVWMLKEFNASVAGFLWEPFLAALFGGDAKQIATSEHDIADIRIFTGNKAEDISLKILNSAGYVKGSFGDLARHFAKGPEQVMRYVIVVKDQSLIKKDISAVNFYEFDISAENFFDWIGNVAHTQVVDKFVSRKFTFFSEKGKQKQFNNTGEQFLVKHAIVGKNKKAREKWIPLAKRKKGGIWLIVPETADMVNLRTSEGAAIEGILNPGAKYEVDLAEFKPGGKGGATLVASYAEQPGIAGKDTDSLWGGVDELATWSQRAKDWNDPVKFFNAVLGKGIDPDTGERIPAAPGAIRGGEGGTQFHISPAHYKGKGKPLGSLRITDAAVKTFFQEAARGLNDDLVLMFNSLADLTDNIGRFFLVDCGGSKCTPEDGAKRNTAGEEAIKNSGDLQRTVDASVKGIKEGGAAVSLGPSLGGRDARGEFEGGTKPTYENKELNLTNDDEVVIIEIER